MVADIGLRLSEGIQDLKLDQQLAPTREAISRTLTVGSTNFFKAVGDVRGRLQQRIASSSSVASDVSSQGTAVEASKSEADPAHSPEVTKQVPEVVHQSSSDPSVSPGSSRPASVTQAATDTKAVLSSWGAGIQSLWTNRTSRFSTARSSIASVASRESVPGSTPPLSTAPATSGAVSPIQQRTIVEPVPEVSEPFVVEDLDHTEQNEIHHDEPTGMAL